MASGRAPRWLRRPVSATFGWGGKLASVQNEIVQKGAKRVPTGKRPTIKLSKLVCTCLLAACRPGRAGYGHGC